MMENLFILLENSINEGCQEELLEFLCDSADAQYLEAAINKIGDTVKEILATELDYQTKITNILGIILGLAEIAQFGPEMSEYLTRCLLSIAVDKSCSIFNLKHALPMIKTLFSDEHIMEWSSTDESLFVPLKLLGVKFTEIGDYECQSILLESLWKISEADRIFWSNMWFTNQKTSNMFLNLNADQFLLDSRKFLNFINRNEINRRTFAYVAVAVSLGSIQLRNPYKSDFWIDFNYDTESISFFCTSLVVENDKTWETIVISSDMVEGYCIQNIISSKTKVLCITLKCSCSQLLSLEDTSIAGLESNLIKISFWSFLDIHHHTEAVFKGNYPDPGVNESDSQHLKLKRRASEPIELVCFNERQVHKHQRRASEPKELLCASYPEETVAFSQNYKHQRASESKELVYSSYPQEKRTESDKRKRRRVSESSTLIPAVDLQHYDVNNIETEANIPDFDIRKRKYTHCKKVSDGYVGSEDFNQNVPLAADCMEEEIVELPRCSNAMYDRVNYNDNVYGNEHDVEPYGNDNDGVDDQNNSSLSNQSQQDTEIITPFKDFPKSNAAEIYLDDDNVDDLVSEESEKKYKKVSGPSCKTHKKGKNTKSNMIGHDSLHNEVEFVKEVNSKIETSFIGSSQSKPSRTHKGISSELQRKSTKVSADKYSHCMPKRSQNSEVLAVPNMSHRKSSQVSVDGCLQSTPKRSQNAEVLAVPNMSQRKSSQVSVDKFLQSTPKKSQNTESLAVYNMPKRKSPELSPIMAVNVNHVHRNVSPELIENGGQLYEEIRNDFDIDDDQVCIDMECNNNLQSKKHKTILGKKNKHKISRGKSSVRLIEPEENGNVILSGPQKTHRRAAVKARKRNKLILEQKGSETEGSQQNKMFVLNQETTENDVFAPPSSKGKTLLPRKRSFFESEKNDDEVLQNNVPKSVKRRKSTKTAKANSGKDGEDHDEYAFCTPPPLVKRRRSRKNSIFVTDTETGSSEVSWFSKFKLFETPTECYSNRKKTNNATSQKKLAKSKLQRDKKSLKTSRPSSQRSKTTDSENRSKKSGFTEIDRFSLVIEKDKNYSLLPANDLSGLYHALDYEGHLRQSSVENDNVQQDHSEELNVAYDNENSIELSGNNELHVSENVPSNAGGKRSQKRKHKTGPSSSIVEVPDVINNDSTILSENKRNMKTARGLVKNKNKDPSKEMFNGRKMPANTTMLMCNTKYRKNIENVVSNELDSITVSENQPKRLKKSFRQGSEKNVSYSITKSQSTSNKTPNVYPNLPISMETVVEVSPFKGDGGITSGRWMSPYKMETTIESAILKSKNTLTEESLSSFNDEKQGKEMLLDHFFESLSSVSPIHQILDLSDIPELPTTPEKSKTKHQKSISKENVVKDRFSKKKQQSPENHQSDLTQEEYNVGSPSVTNKSLQHLEEEHSEKDLYIVGPPESPFQEPLPKLQKIPTKDTISCENYQPMKPSVLHILSDEVSTLTHRLFSTLKKCMSDFREKMVALRVSIVNTADSMISNQSKFTKKDLGALARNCKESRIHIQKHLEKLSAMGNEYFESEKLLERRLSKKHKKAVVKYTKSLQIAQSIAEKALEERFILKSKAFLKSFLKKMELV